MVDFLKISYKFYWLFYKKIKIDMKKYNLTRVELVSQTYHKFKYKKVRSSHGQGWKTWLQNPNETILPKRKKSMEIWNLFVGLLLQIKKSRMWLQWHVVLLLVNCAFSESRGKLQLWRYCWLCDHNFVSCISTNLRLIS